MAISTMTSKGQVTIPKELRKQLGLRAGDQLDFRLDSSGRLTMLPVDEPSYLRLFGLLRHWAGNRPVTVKEMREAVHERARQKYGGQK